MPSITASTERKARVDQIAARFASRWHQGYARGKLKHDPVFDDALGWARRAAHAVGPTHLLDAGCGLGLLSHWLRAHQVAIAVRGVDPDPRKIAAARAAAIRGDLAAVEFETADARDAVRNSSSSVFLLDVLHYLPMPDRDELLARIALNAPIGGVTFIRNGLRNDSWRHGVTRLEEWFVRLTGWIPTRGFPMPDESEITRHFPETHFERTVGPLWGGTPFNSYRFAFVRRG